MKHNFKRTLSVIAAAGMVVSGAAYAQEPVQTDINSEIVLISAQTGENIQLSVNGLGMPDMNPHLLGDTVMVPLRQITEALNFQVGWEDASRTVTLTRGPVYITLSLDSNTFTYSKMAPQSMSHPTELIEGTTYVPVEFVTEVLRVGVETETAEDGTIHVNIVEPRIAEVLEINEDTLLVEDPFIGEVVIRITDDTQITLNGEAAQKDGIKTGENIAVVYSPAMTMSLPPQTNAVSVELNALYDPFEAVEEDTEDVAEAVTVEVLEILDDSSMLVKDPVRGEVIVRADESTEIVNDGQAAAFSDITAGATVEVVYGPIMTASLPAQNTAASIVLNPAEEAPGDAETALPEGVEFEGTIKEITENFVLIDSKNGEIALIVNEDTAIRHAVNKRVYTAEDLEVGMEISGTHSPVMTRSLPPQTVAFEIILNR